MRRHQHPSDRPLHIAPALFASLVDRLRGDGISLGYVAEQIRCTRREAKVWLLEQGARCTMTGKRWAIPSRERSARIDAKRRIALSDPARGAWRGHGMGE